VTVRKETSPNRAVLKLHVGLRKAESSVLVQASTGRIGVAKFLYNRRVPGVLSAQCSCEAGEEPPRHMALFCIEEAGRRQHLQDRWEAKLQATHRDKQRGKETSRVDVERRASSGEPRPGQPRRSWRPDVRQQRSLREPRFSYYILYGVLNSAPGYHVQLLERLNGVSELGVEPLLSFWMYIPVV
jgi:hypothetical protein